jgi:hypothetical protein
MEPVGPVVPMSGLGDRFIPAARETSQGAGFGGGNSALPPSLRGANHAKAVRQSRRRPTLRIGGETVGLREHRGGRCSCACVS